MKKIIASCLMFLSVFTAFAQGEPNDCVNAITVCGNGTFVSNANGIGQVQEVTGCGGFENNSIWIKINIVQAGNLGFDLVPDDTDINVDYDFWVYPANAQCGSLGAPIRCCTTNPVMAGLTNNHTGMNGNTLITQSGPGADGDGYVRWLTVSPGQSYYIVIDRPIGDGGFSINWTGTATFGDGAFPQAPDANQLDEVRTCSNNPNVGVFDLGALKPQINSDTTNNTIEFFTSAANAVDGTSPLSDIISNTSNPQQIYAKVTDNTTGCSSITDFTIAVYPLPNITVTASPQDACPGADVTVTFTGPANANFNYNVDGGAPQSATLDANGSFTITQGYMQDTTYTLEDANITTSDGTVVCSQSLSASVTINVNDMEPLVFTTNGPVCSDDDGVITLTGPANATVNYTIASNSSQTITLDGTGQGIITLPALTATTDFIIIDVTDAQAPFCTVTLNETGTLEVTGAPVLTEPEPMHECIDGNTGVASFDLESNNDAITGGGTFVVTYHMSQADADNDTGAIVSPYESALANQTLFVRVELGSGASCVSFTTIDLIATNAPTVTAPAPQVVCDDNADGLMQFDLTSTINVITGNNASYQVSFFISQTDADADTSAITNPAAYTNTVSGGQTIFARVVDPANTVCYATTSFDLVVNPSPQVPPVISDYELCDFDGDNVEVFDLTTRAAEIGSFTLSYYTSLADATTAANAIADPVNYQSGGEPVYVRSENPNGCFSVTTFNTVVNILPVINNPAPVFAGCEEVSGQADFVLHNHDTAVTGGQGGMTVRYFATQGAAEIGDPADELPQVYVSSTTNIYARVTATATGCWVVITVPLEVIQAPIGENPDALEECDLNGDGSAKFNLQAVLDDLETQMPGVIATAHETQDDADMATNAITETTEYIYLPVTNPSGIIYIRLQSGQTECYDVIELQLIVHPVPEATTPAAYGLCDNGLDDADGEGIFDLT
ncbi:hypothetical protein, partial [Flavobacterium beibuense]|uniref:hypothetical protein n=1 Tax=Flavobacterium beibuense TaxID=657326 RepID=UPI003A95CF42